MIEKSAQEDRYAEMVQQPVDSEVIRQAPDLKPGDEDPSVVEVQYFLKRFGYLDAVAEGLPPERGRLDEVTVRALIEYQRDFDVGTGDGTLDAPTRELMAAPRCGMPDRVPALPGMPDRQVARPGSSYGPQVPRWVMGCSWCSCPWFRRGNFTYAFNRVTSDIARPPAPPFAQAMGRLSAMQAVDRAFNTWAAAAHSWGIGLSFTRVHMSEDPDILVDWRPGYCEDEGFSMEGPALAHADAPIGCSLLTDDLLPKPLHFDQKEHTWGIEWGPSPYAGPATLTAIEDVALHEIGHLLGLGHNAEGNVMQTYAASRRTLQAGDLKDLNALYPPDSAFYNHIRSVHSDKVLDVDAFRQDNGAKIQQWHPIFGFGVTYLNQRFRVEKVGQPKWIGDLGRPEYRFVAFHSGKVLTVEGGSKADGAPIIQWEWEGGANQRFWIDWSRGQDSRSAHYRIQAVHSDKVLDVDAFSNEDGAKIQQWEWKNFRNQLWRFS